METKKLLPIGSVVLLKGGRKNLMIFGVKQTNPENKKVYDYIGVLYPEGYMGPKFQYLFDHEDIDQVIFSGMESEERAKFLEKLSEVV